MANKLTMKVSPATRVAMQNAAEALLSLDTKHLVWLIDAARSHLAERIEKYELELLRLQAPEFAKTPFVSPGACVTAEEDRAERIERYKAWLASEHKLLMVAEKLKTAAQLMSADEFGAQIRASGFLDHLVARKGK